MGTTWTIEGWFRVTSLAAIAHVMGTNDGNDFRLRIETDETINFFADGDNQLWASIAVDTWYHIAISNDAGTARLFLNGVQASTPASTYTVLTSFTATTVEFGALDDGTNGPLNGWLRSWRFTSGVARYTGNFTPPSLPLPTS